MIIMMLSLQSSSQTDTIVCLNRDVTRLVIKELIIKDYLEMENDSLKASIVHLKDINEYNGWTIDFLEDQIDSYVFKDSVQTLILSEKKVELIDLQKDIRKHKRSKGVLWGAMGVAFVLGLIVGL